MRWLLYSVLRFLVIIVFLVVLDRNGLTYKDVSYWLLIGLMFTFGFLDFIEQVEKRYK